MSKQPEALRCADGLTACAEDPMWADHAEITKRLCSLSADHIRRQHALIEEMRKALEACENRLAVLAIASYSSVGAELKIARAALAKAEAQV